MFDPATIALLVLIFILAGAVKGVIGLGLPTVTLGLATVATDHPTAMALMLIPSCVTNLWQALAGGRSVIVLKKIWLFLLFAILTISIGGAALSTVDPDTLSACLGIVLIAYSVINLIGFRLSISASSSPWLGPVFGSINGVLTGMTGSFVVPGVMYLQAIGLSKNQFVQGMGWLFFLSTMTLWWVLGQQNFLSQEVLLYSGYALLPAGIGMIVGQKIRKRLSETTFRKVFFWSILVLGAYIILSHL